MKQGVVARPGYWQQILIFCVFIYPYATVSAAQDKAFFWQVKSDTATVYLMGSIHFADESFYPLRAEIEQAFRGSEYLVVELDIGSVDQGVYQRLLAQRGMLKDGMTIKDVITDDTLQELRRQLKKLNVDYDTVKTYRPGILILTLSAVQAMQLGLDPELGIDAYFLRQAASSSKKTKSIIELESIEQQINLFLDIPNEDLLLKESLYSLDETDQMMTEMVTLWKQGDEAGMKKLLFEEALEEYPEFSKIYDRLFYQRNREMSKKIEAMLDGKGSYFVVVGTGHLVGDRGIVGLLKGKGYDTERR